MPSADGAIGLGLGTWTLLKAPGLISPSFDTKHVERSCGATLLCAHTRSTSHQGCRWDGHAHGRPKHAELAQLGGMAGLGRLAAQEVAG
jgi:hypothetical protein